MKTEIATLYYMGAWSIVYGDENINSISYKWYFKCKCYPDGLTNNFKARFGDRGYQQLEGIEFFDTCAPVVQLATVKLILTLEVLLGLKSKQGDVNDYFFHEYI